MFTSCAKQAGQGSFPIDKWDTSSIEWVSGLEVIKKETHCNEKFEQKLVLELCQSKRKKKCYRVLKDYFMLYIDECGFQEGFKKVLEIIKPNSDESWLNSQLTLSKYLEKQVFKSKYKENLDFQLALRYVLSIIEAFSKMEAISEQTDCTDGKLKTDMVMLVNNSKAHHPKLFGPLYDYFSLYIRQCGYEGIFEDVMNQHGVDIGPGHSPLASYISDVLNKRSKNYAGRINFILDTVTELRDLNQMDKSNCNKDTSSYFETLICNAQEGYYSKLAECLDRIFAVYLRGCTHHFKARAKEFVSKNEETWAVITQTTDIVRKVLPYDSSWTLQYIHSELPLVVYHYIDSHELNSEETAESRRFREQLVAECRAVWKYMHNDMYSMKFDMTFAVEDEEIMSFLTNVSCCWRVAFDISQNDLRITSVFEKLGTPCYKQVEQKSYPKAKNCENGRLTF